MDKKKLEIAILKDALNLLSSEFNQVAIICNFNCSNVWHLVIQNYATNFVWCLFAIDVDLTAGDSYVDSFVMWGMYSGMC